MYVGSGDGYCSSSGEESYTYYKPNSDEPVYDFTTPTNENALCRRCNKKVYPTEKMEIGISLHKYCFKCAECKVTLTLNTFKVGKANLNKEKDVFCIAHAPKLSQNMLDDQSLQIKAAANAQKLRPAPGSRIYDLPGWEYDHEAMEFSHAKHLDDRIKKGRKKHRIVDPNETDYEDVNDLEQLRGGVYKRPGISKVAAVLQNQLSGKGGKPPKKHEYMEPNDTFGAATNGNGYNNGESLYEPLRVARGETGKPNDPRVKPPDFNTPDPRSGAPMPPPNPPPMGRSNTDPRFAQLDAQMMAMNMNGGMPMNGHGMPMNGHGMPMNGHGMPMNGHGMPVNGHGMPMNGHGMPMNGMPNGFPHPFQRVHSEPMMMHPGMMHGPGMVHPGMMGNGNGYDLDYDTYAVPMLARKELMNDQKFMAQNRLELRHRKEQETVFKDFEHMRDEEIWRLEEDLKGQMEKAVTTLLQEVDSGNYRGDIAMERLRIDHHFQRLKEEKMRELMEQLTSQERYRLSDQLDRHSQEMLQLIDSRQEQVKPPSPRPPSSKKRTLYSTQHMFDDLDFHARQVAEHEQGSFTELVYELTRQCKTTLDKSRAIFRWVTIKDLNKMILEGHFSEDSPFYFLKGIKCGIESYHELFKRLCSYAGIHCQIIRGFSKSVGYKPGMTSFNDSRFRNAWCVVYIEDSWRFIDCHWGARHVTTGSSDMVSPNKFRYEYDDFYFLTDPEELIYQHFPDEETWQLLDEPLSMEQFINMPLLKSHFFQYGLKLDNPSKSVVESGDGKVQVILTKPTHTPLTFNSRLEGDDEVIDGYTLHHTEGNQVVFDIYLPRRGVFYFTIFACDTDKAEVYNNVCCFRITCKKVEAKPYSKFPKLPEGYGPTPLAAELGLTVDKHKGSFLQCNDEKFVMNLRFKKDTKVSHKMVFGGQEQPTDEYDRYAFQRFRDDRAISYLIRFPQKGIYAFSIFAADKDCDKPVLDCAARFIIQCNQAPKAKIKPYPRTYQHWLKCRLHEPPTGDLKLNRNVKFKIEVPNADMVAIILKGKWYHLKKASGGLWEGSVFTGKDEDTTAGVYAKYDSRDFFPLLEYKLVTHID